ncbi:hypothetical protein PHYPSEUDO_012570 [Phytophthora pseudosyringae]|uniref:Tubulin epsilon and delta complex protein 1 domain-containing protein n=1 Tax=Phytophthora pseudosyringae TaxID=221518 RepID=A0A8T1V9W6_9STRA|nr:hypothetical protein PHYPSEUDO_012570 [Phytophthora pseudosyringae]
MRAARPDAKPRPKSPSRTPRFGYLLRLGLESVGVRYVSVDLLRKARKNQTTEREYWALWRLLHDLVLVVLAEFQVDAQEMERISDAETLESALRDPELHDIQMELVRFYFYEWGFVCTSFYSKAERPSSQVLLLAVAWVLAFSRFFEKQHRYILERCTGSKQLRLPPFPNDVDLDADCVLKAAFDAVSTAIQPCEKKLLVDGQIHQLHSAFGRLQAHLNELQAYTRYHERLLKRLEKMQNKPEEYRDELIPAHVLHLLAGPTARLTDQVRVLAQSVQMKEDEALFYKWINGLVLSLNNNGSDSASQVSPSTALDSAPQAALRAQVKEVQTLFQAHADSIQQIEQGYKQEWKKWTSRQKSRSRVQQMEMKAERFTHEVQTRELFDPQKLFVRSQRSWEALDTSPPKHRAGQRNLTTKEEVDRLQTQVASVINEITTEYCNLRLR